MKKWIPAAFLLLTLLLAACGKTESGDAGKAPEPDEPDFVDVTAAVKAVLAEDLETDGLQVDDVYQTADLTVDSEESAAGIWTEKMELDPALLKNGTVIAALMNVNADEIIVLEAKDESDAADLKASLEKELNAQTKTWEQYLPDQYEKVKDNRIVTKGRYLLYVTYSDPEAVEKAFADQF